MSFGLSSGGGLSGGGSVVNGTAGQVAFYAATGSQVSGNSNLTVSGGALTIGVAGTTAGSLVLAGSSSGIVTIKTAAAAGTWSMTVPADDGTSGQFLQTDGNGICTWQTVSTGITINSTAIASGTNTRVLFDDSAVVGEDAGLTYNKTNKALTIGGATVTASAPVLDLSQTWNNAAVAFNGVKLNVTNTNSASTSTLLDLQIGGVSQISFGGPASPGYIHQNGAAAVSASGNTFVRTNLGGGDLVTTVNDHIALWNGAELGWASVSAATFSSALDAKFTRSAAATIHLGAADAASPVAQTFGVQGVVAGTSNTAGSDFTLTGSQGTGTGVGGNIVFKVAPAAAGTASTQNALVTAFAIRQDKTVLQTPILVSALPTAGTAGRRAFVSDALTPVFGSTVAGGGSVNVPVYDNGANWTVG